MNKSKFLMKFCSTTAAAAVAIVAPPALAGEITGLVGVDGDGFILIDPDENIVEPGAAAVTTAPNNDDFVSPNGFSPNGVENCILASNGALCDSVAGSGKRVKNNLTGLGVFDNIFSVVPSGGVTEYFNFGKLTNQTGARMTGFRIVIGTGSGDNFTPASQTSEPLTMDQVGELLGQAADWEGNGDVDGQNPLQRAFFPDGLFGNGGQEGDAGYFSSPDRSGFVFVPDGTDALAATSIFGAYTGFFGDGVLSRNQVPEALFFDDDGDPSTEAALLYWKAGDLWLDGAGIVQDAATVDAMLEQDAYYVDIIEDLSNINLNYSFDIGDLTVGEFTVRFIPVFSPMVTAAQTEYQFNVALALDQTEIPYLFLDQSSATGSQAAISATFDEFQEVTDAINSLPNPASIQQALERAGTSYLRNYGVQAQLLGRDQLEHVLQHLSAGRGSAPIAASSARPERAEDAGTAAAETFANSDGSAQVTDRLTVFLSGSLSTGDIDPTLNGAGSDYTGYTITTGADYHVYDSIRLGAAVSYGDNSANIDDGRGELDASAVTLMAYGTFGTDTGLYGDIVGGYSWLDFDNDRNIVIGTLNREASSKTDGKQKSFAAKAGYNFAFGPLVVGPSVQYQYYDLDVDGYSESGAGVLSMTVDDMNFLSETIWLGGQAKYQVPVGNGVIEPRASVHWVKEFKDDGFIVDTRFTDGVLPFFTPIDARDDAYVRAGASVAGKFKTNGGLAVELFVAYDGTFGNSDYSQHRFHLGAALRF